MRVLFTALLLIPTVVSAEQFSSESSNVMGHATLKRESDSYVPREPITAVERYNPNTFRNDPSVLVAGPKAPAIDLNNIPLQITHKRPKHLKRVPAVMRVNFCDDDKEVC